MPQPTAFDVWSADQKARGGSGEYGSAPVYGTTAFIGMSNDAYAALAPAEQPMSPGGNAGYGNVAGTGAALSSTPTLVGGIAYDSDPYAQYKQQTAQQASGPGLTTLPYKVPSGSTGIIGSALAGNNTPGVAAATSPGIVGSVTPWNVTADQTAAAQIASLTDRNSPLNVQARTQALEGMNARGLINSSIAETAGQQAVLGVAKDIGTVDAATFAKAAGYNADQWNQFELLNRNLTNAEKIARIQQETSKYSTDVGASTSKYGTDASSATSKYSTDANTASNKYNTDSQAAIAQLNSETANRVSQDNQVLLNTNSQAASAFNNAMNAIANINLSTTMDGNAKTQAVAQVYANLQSQFVVLGKVSGLNLADSLTFANKPGFNDAGQFVGFDSAGNTAGVAPAAATAPKPPAGSEEVDLRDPKWNPMYLTGNPAQNSSVARA